MSVRWTAAKLKEYKAKQASNVTGSVPKKAKPKRATSTRKHGKHYRVMAGIDPGTKTGLAIKCDGLLMVITTTNIIDAVKLVKEWHGYHGADMLVRIEDARMRQFFGDSGFEKWQGAGSVKRDCRIWEKELIKMGVDYEFVHPKNVKATTAAQFNQLTGCIVRTSIHAREAAWLII